MDEQQKNETPQAEVPQWQYQSGQLAPQDAVQPNEAAPTGEGVHWTASEFVSHEKSTGWYLALFLVAAVIAALTYLLTRQIFSVIVVFVLAIALGVFGAIKPRTLDYAVMPDGISVGDKHFTYETFRSFAVFDDGPVPSIQLLPQKRFMVPITMYFDHEQGDKIIDTLGNFLPLEHKERDLVDKLSSRFHF